MANPDQPEKMTLFELGEDEHWGVWPAHRPEYVDRTKPSQSGTWFVHKGKVFLLVEESECDKIIPGLAFAFGIKSVSSDRAVVLWGDDEITFRKTR